MHLLMFLPRLVWLLGEPIIVTEKAGLGILILNIAGYIMLNCIRRFCSRMRGARTVAVACSLASAVYSTLVSDGLCSCFRYIYI